MDYLCAVQGPEATGGDDLTVVDVPASRYAVGGDEIWIPVEIE
ncbi:MAG: hypothetical protein AAF648_09870 [Pseudomonadota bacterium]